MIIFAVDDEAEIVRTVTRAEKLVGTYQAEHSYGFVVPDEGGYLMDIYVPFSRSHGAVTGDKVSVKIVRFPHGRNPEGEIEEILGKKNALGAEEKSVTVSLGIPDKFPEEVLEYVKERNYKCDTCVGRADFRNETVITVDGEDTRDIDDAISLKTLDNGHFLLGVHIADVSYFVPENSVLDKEAYRRGTSVYFPDNVIPMLPQELSNGICSLNEGEDRFTLSCIMEVDGEGNVVDSNIAESIIRSSCRMSYTAVDAVLEGDESFCEKYSDFLPLIGNMKTLTEILINKRARRGSVDLDVKEADIRVDARGEISINPIKRTFSRRIIHDFSKYDLRLVARAGQSIIIHNIEFKTMAERIAETPVVSQVQNGELDGNTCVANAALMKVYINHEYVNLLGDGKDFLKLTLTGSPSELYIGTNNGSDQPYGFGKYNITYVHTTLFSNTFYIPLKDETLHKWSSYDLLLMTGAAGQNITIDEIKFETMEERLGGIKLVSGVTGGTEENGVYTATDSLMYIAINREFVNVAGEGKKYLKLTLKNEGSGVELNMIAVNSEGTENWSFVWTTLMGTSVFYVPLDDVTVHDWSKYDLRITAHNGQALSIVNAEFTDTNE